MSRRVVFIQGGGVGLDLEPVARRLAAAAGVDIDWQVFTAGGVALAAGAPALPADMIAAVRAAGVALKTKLLPADADPRRNFNVELRRELGLFASLRPVRNLRGLPARFHGVDVLLVREITEDLYAAVEHEIVPGVVQSLKVVTADACRRFFRFALGHAVAAGRRKVHCVHKANILKLADGLFLRTFREAAAEFPALEAREIIVDNCCMQLVSNPRQFDVLVAGNLYGDLLSDLSAGLVGGISATVGINCGDGVRIFESIHGASREAVGADRANPLPIVLPLAELLRALDAAAAADRLVAAAEEVLEAGRVRTPDLGGQAGTAEMAEAIARVLESGRAPAGSARR